MILAYATCLVWMERAADGDIEYGLFGEIQSLLLGGNLLLIRRVRRLIRWISVTKSFRSEDPYRFSAENR
ncbi:hypothetical protein MA16_Dca009021 [Dendrobium catenatum]|uniref:Uncharacterized protein n=1 Tax=Dendrobium catenatum TaxID=906689 RepID=A0A2I0VRA7_9ASPA|nr:hypothetical protein MA16_Dca009021 [Dendrobium catenatum]